MAHTVPLSSDQLQALFFGLPKAFKISVFHFLRMVSFSCQNNNAEQCSEAGDGRIPHYFQGVEDPRKSNATKHDLIEMLTIALLATLTGKSSCNSFARFAKHNCEFLSEFMELM